MQRLTVGICGASGAPLALAVLRALRACAGWESHVIVSRAGWRVLAEECGAGKADVAALAHYLHEDADIGACVASGTFRTAGMLIVPCSMKTLAGIHSGYADSLLLRAADVTLKTKALAGEAHEEEAVFVTLRTHTKGLTAAIAALHTALDKLHGTDGTKGALKSAHAARDKVLPAMLRCREHCDALEQLVDKADWPLPSYAELLWMH